MQDSKTVANNTQARSDYLAGNGRIAMCIPGVRGDDYASSIEFFLRYYRKLGVDTVNLYMHSPGSQFAKIVETIASDQQLDTAKDFPRVVLLPWCLQLGASYKCQQGRAVAPLPGYFDFVGTNHGQLLAHQDCLFRSIGSFRWVLFVDLDEYVVPKSSQLLNLHDLIAKRALQNQGLAPSELTLRTAFYENCSPSESGKITVPLSPSIPQANLSILPRRAWAAARVSRVYPKLVRTKFLCNPHECDRVAVHFDASKLSNRSDLAGRAPYWPISGKTVVVPEHDAIIHHVRANARPPSERETIITHDRVRHGSEMETALECHLVPGVQEQDWSMTNFVINVLGLV
jgi:hypothetical protein